MPTVVPADLVDELNHEYERLHTAKEDAFWTAYMGLSGDSASVAPLRSRSTSRTSTAWEPALSAKRQAANKPSSIIRIGPSTITAVTVVMASGVCTISSPAGRLLGDT